MPDLSDPRASFLTFPPPGYEGGLNGWERLADRIRCQKGIVAVVPDPAPESNGTILLPDEVGGNVRPDIGTVIGSGIDELCPGDRVIYHPWAGVWFKPFRVGRYQVAECAFYGLVSPEVEDLVTYEKIEDVIPCRLAGDAFRMLGEMVLIKRDPLKTQSGIYMLADETQMRTMKATVVSAGPRALGPDGTQLKPGDRVMYHAKSIYTGLKGVGERIGGLEDMSDHAIIRARNLYCTIEED